MAANDKYPLALPEGTVLAGQYVITSVLGQGGFGITYKAQDHKRDISVAIKEFFPDSMATRSQGQTTVMPFTGDRGDNFEYGKQCFLQEAETLAQFIGNDNIVRIYSYFEEYGTAYFVMDYIEGKSLDDHIKEKGGKLSFEEASEILIPVMDALGAVHQRGIVHRDVAPDNIYLTNDGKVKLLDFGAARQSLGDKSQSLDVVLKHGFAPKEQYTRRGRQGPYTDVYALGATFYFAITGKRPPDSLERLDEDDIVLPSTLGAKIPKQAEEALMTALSVRAEDRYQSMSEFKKAFAGIKYDLSEEGADKSSTVTSDNAVQQRFFSEPESKEEASKLDSAQNEISSIHEEVQQTVSKNNPEGKKKAVKIAIVAVVAVLALVGLIAIITIVSAVSSIPEPATTTASTKNPEPPEEPVVETPTETPAPTETPTETTTETSAPEETEAPTETTTETSADSADSGNESISIYDMFQLPWGATVSQVSSVAGSSYEIIDHDDYTGVVSKHVNESYYKIAEGRVAYGFYCDYKMDNQVVFPGFFAVNILIKDYTLDDITDIKVKHKTLFGSPDIVDNDGDSNSSIYERWKTDDSVIYMLVPRSDEKPLEIQIRDKKWLGKYSAAAKAIGCYWGTPLDEVKERLGDGCSVEDEGNDGKCIYNNNWDDYYGVATGRTKYEWRCDEYINNELIPGLCEVKVVIADSTDDELNEIIKIHNTLYGESEKFNLESGTYYTWKQDDTVIDLLIPNEGKNVGIYVYDRGVYLK